MKPSRHALHKQAQRRAHALRQDNRRQPEGVEIKSLPRAGSSLALRGPVLTPLSARKSRRLTVRASRKANR